MSNNVSDPAHVNTRPPSFSSAGFWQNADSPNTNLFSITAPTAAICDITVSYMLASNGETQLTVNTVSDVVGALYGLSMDGPATHIWAAQGVLYTS